MNILIPHSWLKEHLKTKATPQQIAEYLSLCSQSVEKVTRKSNDWIYEIEITTNRPDCLSVYGIARELTAILPRFGIKAQLAEIPEREIKIPKIQKGLPLKVEIRKSSLCPRFTASIFDQITIKPSPAIVQERLKKAGIRALNNVIDISNYLMLELGQPMHTFDYDKIQGAKMTLRESAGGEKITTLDGEKRPLPDRTIIIENGRGRIIDLCGIMGGKNSEVDEKTKRVLLFVQTYDPMKIRQACQKLAFRTEAASRFEKGVEPEGVIPAMQKAITMFEKNCGARIASNLIDIYPHPQKARKVTLSRNGLDRLIGIKMKLAEVKQILDNLGFQSTPAPFGAGQAINITVPHWRHQDISIPEDLIEEVARIYGYHNLPTVLPTGEIPQTPKDPRFRWEQKIKQALKFWGFNETFSYSMISEDLLKKIEIRPETCLKIANPLSEEWVYMRPSLIPSLLEVVVKNQSQFEKIKIFELANIYLPQRKNQLPEEKSKLTGVITGDRFLKAKGIVETLLTEMGIENYIFRPAIASQLINTFHPARTGIVKKGNDLLGTLGEIHPQVLKRFGIEGRVVAFDLDFEKLVKQATAVKKYTPIPKYPPIVEDLCFLVPPRTLVGEMIQLISTIGGFAAGGKSRDSIIKTVELIDSYKDTRTFRITYQSQKKTLTDREVEKIRKKIISHVSKRFKAQIKE